MPAPSPLLPDPASYRIRRVVVAVAAATAVVLGPTACDIGTGATADPAPVGTLPGNGYSGGYSGGHAGHGPDQLGEAASIPVASIPAPVPVNAVRELGPSEEPTPAGPAEDTPDEDAGGSAAPPEPSPTRAADPDESGDPDPADPVEPADPADPVDPTPTTAPSPTAAPSSAPASAPASPAPSATPAPLQTLGGDCTGSGLAPHDGFQNAPRCVSIAFGEVAGEDRSPSLLITEAPTEVGADEAFTLQVSTRNLVRDRFLGAAAGGYYRESSFLNGQGIQRGHFHTACRLLADLTLAPDAQPAPAFFLATQDNGGGREPDQVRVPVPGLKAPGTYQCAVWAGDGSHRLPMMQRANQTPAFDAVRITVG